MDIDDDLLVAVREVARRNSEAVSAVAFRLLRQALADGQTEGGSAVEGASGGARLPSVSEGRGSCD